MFFLSASDFDFECMPVGEGTILTIDDLALIKNEVGDDNILTVLHGTIHFSYDAACAYRNFLENQYFEQFLEADATRQTPMEFFGR